MNPYSMVTGFREGTSMKDDFSDMDRRRFIGNVSRWAAAGAALLSTAACDVSADVLAPDTGEDDLAMYGPIRQAERWLSKELAQDAVPLLAPFHGGQMFLRRWAVGHLVRGEEGQLVVVMVDLDTGGHAELEIFARAPGVSPVAHSQNYTVHLNDGGMGDRPTPRHLRELARRIATIMRRNEKSIRLSQPLPTFRTAEATRKKRWAKDPEFRPAGPRGDGFDVFPSVLDQGPQAW